MAWPGVGGSGLGGYALRCHTARAPGVSCGLALASFFASLLCASSSLLVSVCSCWQRFRRGSGSAIMAQCVCSSCFGSQPAWHLGRWLCFGSSHSAACRWLWWAPCAAVPRLLASLLRCLLVFVCSCWPVSKLGSGLRRSLAALGLFATLES